MKYKRTSESDRTRIFETYKRGEDWRTLATTLGVNCKTAYKWLLKDQETPLHKGGNFSKKTPHIINKLVSTIEDNCLATLADLKKNISEEFSMNVCTSTIRNWLDGSLITLKNTRKVVDNMNKEENKTKRATYIEHLLQHRSEGRTLIWTDETNFNLYCKRSQGRSRIGTRASVVLPASKGANLHCIGPITSGSLLLFTTRRGAFKSDACLECFRELARTCQNTGIEHPTFIIDNAPAHCKVESIVVEFPQVKVLRLAPYSYLLNPIELMWSVFKSHLKRMLQEEMPRILNMTQAVGIPVCEQRMQQMEHIAGEAIRFVTPIMLTSFCNRVERYYATVSRQEDLKELP